MGRNAGEWAWTLAAVLAAHVGLASGDGGADAEIQSYLATASGPLCPTLAVNINRMARAYNPDYIPVRDAEIGGTCFLHIQGAPELAEVVGTMADIDSMELDPMVQASSSWGLDRIDQAFLPLSGTPFSVSYDGSGVNIYLLDTGVMAEHNEFGGRATLAADFSARGQGAVLPGASQDEHGHGTHCAAAAMGASAGVARGAALVGVKVLDSDGRGSVARAILGLGWVLENAVSPSVVTLPFSGLASDNLDFVVRHVAQSGHIVVVAAGNNNTDACLSSPSRAAGGDGLASQGIVSVASSNVEDVRSSDSNFGSCVSIFAPGDNIESASTSGADATRVASGTSVAAAFVAGTAAALLQKHNMDPEVALSELYAAAHGDLVEDAGEGSSNLMLQVLPLVGPVIHPGPGDENNWGDDASARNIGLGVGSTVLVLAGWASWRSRGGSPNGPNSRKKRVPRPPSIEIDI